MENQENLQLNEDFTESIIPVASVNTKDKHYLTTVHSTDDKGNLFPERYILRNVKTGEMKEVLETDLYTFEIVSNDDDGDDIQPDWYVTRNVVVNPDVEASIFSEAFKNKEVHDYIQKVEAQIEVADNPLDTQTEGDYYKQGSIQPIEYIHANKLGYIEGCVVKYITRYKFKNDGKDGLKDLKKIKHYIDLLIKLEYESDNN